MLLKRKAATTPVGEPVDEVRQARARARRRLIGAVVLLAFGIVGFPLVFETQPRPIPVDIPIDIPRKDGAPPLTLPPPAAAAIPATRAAPEAMITEPREEPARNAAPAGSRAATAAKTLPETRPQTDARPAPDPRQRVEEAARARALLEGAAPASAAAAGTPRFVVQVGAFADATAAHDTRQKMEKLGLKTYTQAASTAAGGRIRVRVGPFSTREEADRALARARGAGLAGVVITL